MPSMSEREAWVQRVLGVSLAPKEQMAVAAGGMLAEVLPEGDGQSGIFDIIKDKLTDVQAKITGTDPRKVSKQALLDRLARLMDPPDAAPDETKSFAAPRAAGRTLLAPEAPPAPELDEAGGLIAALAQAIEQVHRRRALGALKQTNPAAAQAAQIRFRTGLNTGSSRSRSQPRASDRSRGPT